MSTMVEKPVRREVTLDLLKGVLVVFMVLYHAINYTTNRFLAFQLFAFLPPSFVLIAGYLVAAQYGRGSAIPGGRPSGRLVIRGFKLIALFTALNLAILLVVKKSFHGQTLGISAFFENWFTTFVLGDGRFSAFEVLLPIGYFLCLNPLLLAADRVHWLTLPALILAMALAVVWMEGKGIAHLNLQMVMMGLVGMMFGRFNFGQLRALGSLWWVAALGYAGFFAWGTAFGQFTLIQCALTFFGVTVLYGWCANLPTSPWAVQHLVRLGQYSLVAYVAQIAALQILGRLVGTRPDVASLTFAGFFVAALLLTSLSVEILARFRARSRVMDGAYKAVFA